MSKIVMDVPEISCEHCSQAIVRALQPQTGVVSVRVDVPSQQVFLEYDEQAISLDQVKSILADEEYPVEQVTPA
jgi:copper chaperone CopZ